ncbi:MAG: hypothetical protein E7529_06060 [Ruminococcaceae bacterium]|nr:hypothetical protein [Oscillospiraceae bacterium]
MNDNREYELFTEEELNNLDERLKKAENVELPESLSSENIENLIKDVPQDEASVEPAKPKKRNKKKIILKSISAAAAVIVAVTSVAVIRPWEKVPPKVDDSVIGNPPKQTQDYTEIEEMFAGYANEYQTVKFQNESYTLKGFGSIFGNKSDSAIMLEDAVDMNAAPQADAESGVVLNEALTQTTTTSDNKTQHGETNEQVQGVSEADIIKNDGKYLYIVSPDNADWDTYYRECSLYYNYKNGLEETTARVQSTPGYNPNAEEILDDEKPEATKKEEKTTEEKVVTELPKLRYSCEISIIEPNGKGELKNINKIEIAKPQREDIFYMNVQDMYVAGNRLIAILNCQLKREENSANEKVSCDCLYGGSSGKNITMAVAYDISDRENVKEEWRVFQDGGYISSRLIGDELVLLSQYYVDITQDVDTVKETCVPENSCDGKKFSRVLVNDICIMEDVYDTSYLVASVLDTDDESTLKTEAVLGAGQNVYCTTETLYATSTEYNTGDARKAEVFGLNSTEKTQIYKFDIRNYDIKYLKNASVDGSALNQFSMDEYNGYLRIATTSGNWGENLINQVYILDENLETVGLLKDIAKGERIKSVRFTGNTAYVVTFVQTDPLFVIDLTDVKAPKILGELKIPGYSAYLHPVGDGLVMGVGLDGTETGTNGGMKVSLFDVSDPTKPVECGKFTMSGYENEEAQVYVDSDAYYDHKALCWDAQNKIMYIPYSKNIHRWSYSDGENYNKTTAGIVALKVNEAEKALTVVGEYIANSTDYAQPDEFARATYINNVIFGYSRYTGLLCSFDKGTQKQLDTLNISR